MSDLSGAAQTAGLVGREYGVAFGNATSGLFCALKAAGLHGAGVAVPYNVCPNVVLAILFTGNTPVFVDIERETNGMDPAGLRSVAGRVKGVIAVHSYGAVCAIAEIGKICSEQSLFLIEDCAQALGARSGRHPVGRHGRVSVFSFGRGKIIDVGHGGVALTDDAALSRDMERLAETLGPPDEKKRERIAEFNDLHTMFYNRFWERDVSRFSFVFQTLARSAQDAFLQRFDASYDMAVRQALARLPRNLEERRQKAERFKSECRARGILFFEPPDGSVYWRFNVYLKTGRDRVLQALLEEGFKISSWYPAVDPFFYETGDVRRRGFCADILGEEILNLWVNEEVPPAYGREIMERIESCLQEVGKGALAGRKAVRR